MVRRKQKPPNNIVVRERTSALSSQKLFEQYLIENLNAVYRFAYSYVKNQQDAEDIVNDSVIKAIRSIHQLRNMQYMKIWFYKIIANTALTYLKKKQKVVFLDDTNWEDTMGSPDDYSILNISDMIAVLPPQYKSIIVLRFFENMTLHEISQVLQLNENTVKTRLYKALRLLKADMECDDV